MSALNKRIADLLAEHRRLKAEAKNNRREMMEVAVEHLGIEQKEALQMNLEPLLDGYLVGQGVHQSWRGVGDATLSANKQTGFTLIEAMVVLAVVGIVASVVVGAVTAGSNGALSFGVNGATESRCIDGFRFVIGADGSARQVLDEFGKGARCN